MPENPAGTALSAARCLWKAGFPTMSVKYRNIRHILMPRGQKDGHIDIKAGGTPGNATISGSYRRIGHSWHIDGKAVLDKLDVGLLSGNKRLSDVSGELDGTATLGYKPNAQIKATVSELCFDNYCYTGIRGSSRPAMAAISYPSNTAEQFSIA